MIDSERKCRAGMGVYVIWRHLPMKFSAFHSVNVLWGNLFKPGYVLDKRVEKQLVGGPFNVLRTRHEQVLSSTP